MTGAAGSGGPSTVDRPAPGQPAITELGVDIVRVERIRRTLERFGPRFSSRVLTSREAAYVRGRAETLAGRWAAKEAVSKVLGLGVRGIGWQDIEIERLPTGQPAVVLHGRAKARAAQLGMAAVALSISHEAEFAVAVASGSRTAGGRYVFPPDIEARLDEREGRLQARLERLRALAAEADGLARASRAAADGTEIGSAKSGHEEGGLA
ncbi:MAG: holo-ACP synthase [Candidatus Limnocylindrales bacterium]